MKDTVRRSSRVPRQSAEKAQRDTTSSKRSRKSLSAANSMMTRRSTSNISKSRSPPPKRSAHLEEVSHTPVIHTPPPKVFAGNIMDLFCWVCHKLTDESLCNKCPRVYHTDCLKHLNKGSSNSLTCECNYKSVEGRTESYICHPVVLRKALGKMMSDIFNCEQKIPKNKQQTDNVKFCKLFKIWPDLPVNSKLCQIVDLYTLIDRINGTPPYGSTNDFFISLKWIHHNSYIAYGPDNEITHAAAQLEKSMKLELMDLEACPECYENMHCPEIVNANFFVEVCEEPHEVVWAKLRGSPYWPAKVIAVRGNGTADVRFFGTHDKSILHPNQLLKYSVEHPGKNTIKKAKYIDAMTEVNVYISNVEAKHGRFKYYPKNTPFLSMSKSPVKTQHKRKRPRSKANQPEDESSNSENICGSPSSLRVPLSPSLNVSILHDGETDIKMNPDLPSSEILINLPSAMGENADPNFSEPTTDVQCHMTWHVENTDEENGPNELNTSDDFIGENATPECSLPENQLVALYPSAPSTSPCVGIIENPENDSNHFVSTTSCNTLPVITSTVSSCSAEASTNENFTQTSISSPEAQQTSAIISAGTNNATNVSEQEKQYLTRLFSRPVPINSDDEEIQLITETQGNTSLVSKAKISTDDSSLLNALTEAMLANRPAIKELLSKMLQSSKYYFLMLWLQASDSRLEANDIKGFQVIYEKCLKQIGKLKCIVDKLQSEKYKLELKVQQLESRQSIKNLFKDRIVRKAIEAEKLRQEKEFEEKVKEYESKIKHFNKDIENLKEDLDRYKNKSIKETADVMCQTDILETFSDKDKETNIVSTNVKSDMRQNFIVGEGKNVVMQRYHHAISVIPPPPSSGLTGSFINETTKIMTEEQMYRTVSTVPAPPISAVVIPNIVPTISNPAFLNPVPSFPYSTQVHPSISSSKPRLNQISKSRVHESRSSARNSKKGQK